MTTLYLEAYKKDSFDYFSISGKGIAEHHRLIHSLGCCTWDKELYEWQMLATQQNLDRFKSAFKDLVRIIIKKKSSFKRRQAPNRNISEENKNCIRAWVAYLRGLRYSKSTVDQYFSVIADFFHFLPDNIRMQELDNSHVEAFCYEVLFAKQVSISTHRQFISAVKLFTRYHTDCKIDAPAIFSPDKDKLLPDVLSPDEVIRLIATTKNLKHRLIIGLLYAGGLRISELINLRVTDINFERRQLFVRKGKGRKDRVVVLASSLGPMIQHYFAAYKPIDLVFEGQRGGKYSSSSIRKFLNRSVEAAGIGRHVNPHMLRHSYATHLLEQGVDIRYIQELLGHSRLETTMIYTHVARKDLISIESPLDIAVKQHHKNLPNKRP